MREYGVLEPAGDGTKVNEATRLGMFQLRRPLYVLAAVET